jgi:hypothetical protein
VVRAIPQDASRKSLVWQLHQLRTVVGIDCDHAASHFSDANHFGHRQLVVLQMLKGPIGTTSVKSHLRERKFGGVTDQRQNPSAGAACHCHGE